MDELSERYAVPDIDGPRVFVTGQALRARGIQLGYKGESCDHLLRWLHADIVAVARRKAMQNEISPNGHIVIDTTDGLGTPRDIR